MRVGISCMLPDPCSPWCTMARRRLPRTLPGLAALLSLVVAVAVANTDQTDVEALTILFQSMNKPSALSGWKSSNGDPCDDGWKGISCSGSSVKEIDLSGLGLKGTLGYQLSSLKSVTKFDVSGNKLNGDIPYALPPNLVQLNMQGNSFTGVVPYSISQMSDLETLNLGNNKLSGQLTDMFPHLPKLSTMDLSFNNLSGSLPQSFEYLTSLKTLNLESNQFSGHIDVLGKLPLQDLNLQNNNFTGWIPSKLKNIDSIQTDGNPWSSGSAPPGMVKGSSVGNSSKGGKTGGINGFIIGGIVMGVLLAILILLSVLKWKRTSYASSQYTDESSRGRSFAPLFEASKGHGESLAINMKSLEKTLSMDSRTPLSLPRKSISDSEFELKLNTLRRSSDPASLVAYSSSDLQAATGSFHTSTLIGQGTTGRIFKAKCAEGRVLAVKKLDPLSFSGSSDFMDVVNGISKLCHPHISEFLGYCSEPGHYMLVYEYQMNGSLYDFLHLSDAYSRPLTWDTRVRIALGTARALEYMHDTCSPSVIHRNVKSSNVLLDAELNPRLSDCGLSFFYEDPSQSLGPGYSPPECTRPSAYVMKSEVYSFGVIMLELLTGGKPYDSSKQRTEQSLVKYASPQLHDINSLEALADPALRGLYPPKALSRFGEIVARCVQSDPAVRPSMSEVSQWLKQCVQRANSFRKIGYSGQLGTSHLGSSMRSDNSDW